MEENVDKILYKGAAKHIRYSLRDGVVVALLFFALLYAFGANIGFVSGYMESSIGLGITAAFVLWLVRLLKNIQETKENK